VSSMRRGEHHTPVNAPWWASQVWRPVWDELAAIWDSRDRTCIDLVAWDAGGQGDSKLVPGTEDFCWSRCVPPLASRLRECGPARA
jgi:hypothetical protein